MLTCSKASHPQILILFGLLLASTAAVADDRPSASSNAASFQKAQVVERYGKLPLSFEANQGQADPAVKFLSRGSGYSLFLTGTGAVLALSGGQSTNLATGTEVVRMQLAGANKHIHVAGADPLRGTANYFLGSDPSSWHTRIPTYSRVRYSQVYPGVDLVYYGNQRQLEYDFVLAPRADPGQIALRFKGARRLRLTPEGDLEVLGRHDQIVFHKPALYQQINSRRLPVEGAFLPGAHNTVRFRVGHYDPARSLTIDPVLIYSTYLGGSGKSTFGDQANAIAVDATGNAYIAGYTDSTDFPLNRGAFQSKNKATWPYTAFVTKLAASGSDLVYSTYLGGSTQESAQAIAVDKAGNAYVAGVTWSSDFPVTRGAFQTQRLGDATFTAFVSVLNPGGSALVYSTYLGSKESYVGDRANAIAVDAAGEAFVAGTTDGPSFPVTSGAFQTKINTYTQTGDQATGFVAKFNAAGSSLVYCTYLGGSGNGNGGKNWIADSVNAIALDGSGDAYLAGTTYSPDFPVSKFAFQSTNKANKDKQNNGFAAELNAAGSALVYSTYLGGSGNASGPADPYGHGDTINALALDSSGNAYVAGHTYSSDFPVTSLAFQKVNKSQYNGNAFVTEINPNGSALVYSTFLGGKNDDSANAIAVDARGEAFVAGAASSSDFPITRGAYQTQNFAAYATVFATELDPGGSALIYSTFLGGATYEKAYALALDNTDMAYLVGQTSSTDFPVTSGSYQTKNHAAGATAFVTKMLLTAPAGPAATTTTLASSANPAALGTPVTFKATVSSKSAMPSGSVAFTIGTNPSVSANLNGSGQAIYTTNSLAVGAHSVTAAYPGNSSFAPSTSAALTETITKPQAFPPTFSPAVGSYRTRQFVTLTDATKGATIYFTTNGNAPSISSTVFKNPIQVAQTTTIKAIAAATGYTNSIVASGTYFITPLVTTQAASGLTATSALLHATVNANNATTQYWFAYGTTSALGATTPKTGALTGTIATPVTVTLTGLKSKTTYYFMAVASNVAGTTNGAVLSFKTK